MGPQWHPPCNQNTDELLQIAVTCSEGLTELEVLGNDDCVNEVEVGLVVTVLGLVVTVVGFVVTVVGFVVTIVGFVETVVVGFVDLIVTVSLLEVLVVGGDLAHLLLAYITCSKYSILNSCI